MHGIIHNPSAIPNLLLIVPPIPSIPDCRGPSWTDLNLANIHVQRWDGEEAGEKWTPARTIWDSIASNPFIYLTMIMLLGDHVLASSIHSSCSFFLSFFFSFIFMQLGCHMCVATMSHLLAQVDLQGERETWKVPCWKPCHKSAHCTTVVTKYGLFGTQEFHGNFTEVYVFL